MSRSSRRLPDEDGFGLVEIIISMTIFMFVAVGTAPFIIGALQSSSTARLNLQAKAVGQERLERMRNLPFHVAQQNGAYIDILDTYFRDLNPALLTVPAPDTCSTRRYLVASATYECTITRLGTEYTGFSQVVSSQFVNANRAVVTPQGSYGVAGSYDSQIAGTDAPAANLLAVKIVTRWIERGKNKSFVVTSHVANANGGKSLIRTSLDASAVRVSGNLAGGDILDFRGGLVNGEASLTTGSRVSLGVSPARISLASGAKKEGAAISVTAPKDATGSAAPDTVGQQLDGSCELACFGPTAVTGDQMVAIVAGLPRASLEGSQATGTLTRGSTAPANRGFSYSNVAPSLIDSALGLNGPVISGLGGGADVLKGSGYLDATGTGASAVRSSASVSLPMLQLFPAPFRADGVTPFAPNGVVQVELTSASLACASGAGSGSVAATWAGKVRYMTPTGYETVDLTPGGAPLPNPVTTFVAPGVPLSKYISAWSNLTNPAAAVVSATRTAQGEIAGIVTILTTNTRSGDNTSPITVTIGSLGCVAEDNR